MFTSVYTRGKNDGILGSIEFALSDGCRWTPFPQWSDSSSFKLTSVCSSSHVYSVNVYFSNKTDLSTGKKISCYWESIGGKGEEPVRENVTVLESTYLLQVLPPEQLLTLTKFSNSVLGRRKIKKKGKGKNQ